MNLEHLIVVALLVEGGEEEEEEEEFVVSLLGRSLNAIDGKEKRSQSLLYGTMDI